MRIHHRLCFHLWWPHFLNILSVTFLLEDKDSKKNQGYGNCERLVGKSFTDVVKRFQGEFIFTTMDVHVVPPNGYQEDEIYKVSVKQYSKPRQGVFFLSFVRVTKYNKFVTCQDKSVDIKLCACAKNQTSNTKNGVLLENGVPREMFGAETKVKNLDSNCLLFLRRDFGTFSFTLEVTNVCTDRTYKFSMTGSMDQRIFSTALPINRVLPPKTFFFLTSVFKYLSKVNQALNLRASIQVKKDGSSEFSSLGTVSVSWLDKDFLMYSFHTFLCFRYEWHIWPTSCTHFLSQHRAKGLIPVSVAWSNYLPFPPPLGWVACASQSSPPSSALQQVFLQVSPSPFNRNSWLERGSEFEVPCPRTLHNDPPRYRTRTS